MVSDATERTYESATKRTSRGTAFYLHGSKEPGYLVNAPTERRIKRFLRWERWIDVAVIVAIVQLPTHFLVRLVLCVAATTAIHHLALRFILRNSERSDIRWEADGSGSEPLAYHGVYRLVVLFIAALVFFAFGVILSDAPVDKWLFALGGLGFVGTCAFLRFRRVR